MSPCAHLSLPIFIAAIFLTPTSAVAAVDVFGGWMLDRDASKLTMAPMVAETVVIVPWGNSGWVWSQISGGPYQPEDLKKGVKPPAEVDGAAADAALRTVPTTRVMYWASWDAKPFATHGRDPSEIAVKRLNDQPFEAMRFNAPQQASDGVKSVVAFSPDGQHLTVTTKDDVRVYDRIDPAHWPSRAFQTTAAPGTGLPCSGIWSIDESLTYRTRSPLAPFVQYFGPWGKNGWVRMNSNGMESEGQGIIFNVFNGNAYQVFGGDAREQIARQIAHYTFETSAIRFDKPADKSVVQFSQDCKRLTFTSEGTDRRTGKPYVNDIRVYDMIEP
jgi:hypothetical protein